MTPQRRPPARPPAGLVCVPFTTMTMTFCHLVDRRHDRRAPAPREQREVEHDRVGLRRGEAGGRLVGAGGQAEGVIGCHRVS